MNKNISQLNEDDVYTLVFFLLYKLKDDPDYAVASELVALLDKQSLLKLCAYYGGKKLQIPEVRDIEKMLDLIDAIIEVNVKHAMTIQDYCIRKSMEPQLGRIFINKYFQICELLKDYEFNTTQHTKNTK